MTTPPGPSTRIDAALGEQALLIEPPSGAAGNATPRPVHQLFEAQAARTPLRVAVETATSELTYQALNEEADRFAQQLATLGVARGDLIGLYLDRGPAAIVAILGILKAGAAYLPLDPTYPTQRLQLMLADARPRGILTTSSHQQQLKDSLPADTTTADTATADPCASDQSLQVWRIEAGNRNGFSIVEAAGASQPRRTLVAESSPDDLAYAIFTSGSTGTPKAVLVAHRGLRNLCQAQQEFFPVHAESRVLQFASLSFDASVSEVFVTLTCGATLCLESEGRLAPSQLPRTLNERRITVATIPPSVLASMGDVSLPALETLVTAGESCPAQLVRHFSGSLRLVNAYGPTEATVCATMHVCDPADVGQPPIGPAMRGCDVFLLNERQALSPPGETGELYLGGVGLALGYLNRPQLTAERFVTLEIDGRARRLYRTGDLARRRADGVFEFVGRRDHQVKIRGVRIELGEVEHALQQHPHVNEAIVTVEEADGVKRLVAHVASGNGAPLSLTPLSSADIRAWMRKRVAPAMLPAEIFCRTSMPLLPNGKIDRKQLHKAATNPSRKRDDYNGEAVQTRIAPRDRFELQTLEAFRGVLEVDELSVADDFFILGGDSLQAMDLIARLETTFGATPSMAELMRSPTVEGLARTIAAQVSAGEQQTFSADGTRVTTFSRAWNPLVPLSPADATIPTGARPMYCVHPGGGNALCFLDLARRLAGVRPVMGIVARGLEPGQTPLETVRDMAEEYLAAIREHQPQGPYAIAGWSFGGMVAFEMANLLIEAGEEVDHLAIIDIGLLYSFGVLTTLFPVGDLSLLELRRLPPDEQIREFSKRTAAAKLIPPGAPEDLTQRIYDTFMANVDAMMNYRPTKYSGKMTLYQAADPLIRTRRDLATEWAEFCDDIDVCTVSGNHLTLIHEPHVAELAAALSQRLR